tara:strand:+ start:315 stop:566 length:252 start_codon:yes stop_codon:yes gene_type:complete
MKTIFNGSIESGTEERELSVDYQDGNICVEIVDRDCDHDYNFQYACLDKSTAIKFVKRMRREINRLAREEAYLESLKGGNQDA